MRKSFLLLCILFILSSCQSAQDAQQELQQQAEQQAKQQVQQQVDKAKDEANKAKDSFFGNIGQMIDSVLKSIGEWWSHLWGNNSSTPSPVPPSDNTSIYVINTDGARGRLCPNTSSKCAPIATFHRGDEITVTGTTQGEAVKGNNTWLVVLQNNTTIYVHSSLASPKVAGTIPSPITSITAIPNSSDLALLAPFNNGVTWTLKNGYYENQAQDKAGCGIGFKPLDHCRNQLFGLDLLPDAKFQSDREVLAPIAGKVYYITDSPNICIILTLNDNVSLNVCHFDTVNVKVGDTVQQGQVLGIRSTAHVHLSLDDRHNKGNFCKTENCFLPIPFVGPHTLEGFSLPPNHSGTGNLVDLNLVFPMCAEKAGSNNCQFMVQFQEYQKEITGQSHNHAIR